MGSVRVGCDEVLDTEVFEHVRTNECALGKVPQSANGQGMREWCARTDSNGRPPV